MLRRARKRAGQLARQTAGPQNELERSLELLLPQAGKPLKLRAKRWGENCRGLWELPSGLFEEQHINWLEQRRQGGLRMRLARAQRQLGRDRFLWLGAHPEDMNGSTALDRAEWSEVGESECLQGMSGFGAQLILARLQACADPRLGLATFESLLALTETHNLKDRLRALEGWAECWLDCGSPTQAAALLRRHGKDLHGSRAWQHSRAALLEFWSVDLAGDQQHFQELCESGNPWISRALICESAQRGDSRALSWTEQAWWDSRPRRLVELETRLKNSQPGVDRVGRGDLGACSRAPSAHSALDSLQRRDLEKSGPLLRSKLGASVLAVFACADWGAHSSSAQLSDSVALVHCDLASAVQASRQGLEGRARRFLDGVACREFQAVGELWQPVVKHWLESQGALESRRIGVDPYAKSTIWWPVQAPEWWQSSKPKQSKPVGWLLCEWSHHNVPSAATLQAWADAWRSVLGVRNSTEVNRDTPIHSVVARDSKLEVAACALRVPASSGCSGGAVPAYASVESALGRASEDCLRALGAKFAERSWAVFVREHVSARAKERPEVSRTWQAVARSAGDTDAALVSQLNLERRAEFDGASRWQVGPDSPALGSGARVGLSVHLGNWAQPMLFVLDSRRASDFDAAFVKRLLAHLGRWSVQLRLAAFSDWHAQRFGEQLVFDGRRSHWGQHFESGSLALQSQAPLVLWGPPGSGKRSLCRWAHYEEGLADLPCWSFSAPLDAPIAEPTRSGNASPGALDLNWTKPFDACELSLSKGPSAVPKQVGSVILEELDAWPQQAQRALLERLRRPHPNLRVLVTCSENPGQIPIEGRGESSGLCRDLAWELDRFALEVPGLRARRQEIELLVESYLCQPKNNWTGSLSEAALAELWRQPWRGNLPELRNFAMKLARLYPNERLGAAEVRDVAKRFKLRWLKRLPLRNSDPSDVNAALECTRTKSGRWNKSRAARYLGWDPDTLEDRIRRLKLTEECSLTGLQ